MSESAAIWKVEYLGVHGELEAQIWCADACRYVVRPCQKEFQISEKASRYSNSEFTKIMVTFR